MDKTARRRTLGVLGVILLSQVLSACVVVPVPARRMRPVVVEPAYGPPPPYYGPGWKR